MIKPILYRVVLKIDAVEKKSKGGIIIHSDENQIDRARKGSEEGTIVAIGDTAFSGFDAKEVPVSVGDRVMIPKYTGIDKKIGDDLFRIINDEDIVAVVPQENK